MHKICSTRNPPPGGGLSLAAEVSKLWASGQTLRIRFIGGTPFVQGKVQQFAMEWTQHTSLKFDFGNHATSDIRISFDPNGGSNSYIGKDALSIAQNRSTMNFGWFTSTTDDAEFRRTTLHEFGHALGFVHEHQSPAAEIPWDEPKVYDYYKTTQSPPWSKDDVDQNIFATYDQSTTNFSAFDKDSVMLYSIPNSLTLGNFETPWNTSLSAKDKQHAALLYPEPTVGITVTFTLTNNSGQTVSFRVVGNTSQNATLANGKSQQYVVKRTGAPPHLIISQPDIIKRVGPMRIKIPQPPIPQFVANGTFVLKKVGSRIRLE